MPASLDLTLTNALGEPLNDRITVDLFSAVNSNHLNVSERIQGTLTITGIPAPAGQVYRVVITPSNYRIAQRFATFMDGQTTRLAIQLPADASKVIDIQAPSFDALSRKAQEILSSAQVPRFNNQQGGFLTGSELYSALDPVPLLKACFLNIVSKSAATPLPSGTCLDHYNGLLRIEQDRLFVRTTAALVEETSQSTFFHSAPSNLHQPVPGYHIVSSFKTFDHYGNLQLTFQRQGEVGNDYVVDIDIDDAQGVEHIFQVLRNSVDGPTNPYNIHEILLQQQPRVDPGYRLTFSSAAASPAR